MKKVRDGYKMTELGDIPIEWEVRYLEDVCEILDSYRKPIKASDREEMKGDIPYYGASGVIDWINDFIFDEELILLGEDGENLNSRNTDLAFKISGKSWVNNHAHVFRIANKNRDNIDFMVYYLESKDYSRYIAGSAQPKITQAQCRKFLLPSPDLKEQEKIASILSTVDEQIDNVDALIEKNKELKKGLMQTLLTKGIGHTKFKTTEIGEIPEEWEVKKIIDIATTTSGGTPSRAKKEYYENGIYPWVKTGELYNKYISETEEYITEDALKKSSAKLVQEGAVIIAMYGATIGKLSIAKRSVTTNQACCSIICNDNICYNEYLYYRLDFEKENIINLGAGGAQPNISQDIIKSYKLAIPSIVEQQRIALILSEIDEKIDEYENKKQKLEEIKKGLMQQLLTGRIRVI